MHLTPAPCPSVGWVGRDACHGVLCWSTRSRTLAVNTSSSDRMAPPHDWYDGFLDAGWPAKLTPAALRLVLAVGRRVDRHTRSTRIALARLQRESGLPRPTFFRAKGELVAYRLLIRAKVAGKWTLTLASPVPEVPPERSHRRDEKVSLTRRKGLNTETEKSHRRDYSVSLVRPTDGQNPPGTRVSGDGQQKTEEQTQAQLQVQIQAQTRGSSLALEPAGQEGALVRVIRPALPSASPAAVIAVCKWAEVAARSRADRERRITEALSAVCGKYGLPKDAVREAIEKAGVVLHPVVQAAVTIFSADILEVR